MNQKQGHDFRKQDPNFAEETKKYTFPVPSRQYILNYLSDYGKPISAEKLIHLFQLQHPDEHEGLTHRLRAMTRDGQLMCDRRGRYCLIDKLKLIPGRVIGHPDGYGFVEPDKGGDDLFLSASQMKRVLHGDRVLVREIPTDRKNRREGMILEVLQRNTEQVTGRFFCEQGICFVEADNRRISQDILIPKEHCNGARPGQMVIAQIIAQPARRQEPIGKIIEVLGEHLAPGMEIEVAIRSHGIPHEWPEKLQAELNTIPSDVSPQEVADRKDLRAYHFVTIDGDDAKDFDDAVYAEALSQGGFCLYVAIADVSHYVRLDTVLDTEAQLRGNSVYFPGRVVPMLPEKLSNELCSLNPKVDRLVMVAELRINAEGKLSRYRFYNAVIHSKARLTYRKVQQILVNKDAALIEEYKTVVSDLNTLYALYQLLHQRRVERGAIDFSMVETSIVFDDAHKIAQIIPSERYESHRLIEECMLLANIAAARLLDKHQIPGLYRIHQEPPPDKIESVRKFLTEHGLTLKGGKKPRPADFANLLHDISERPDRLIIQKIILFSMSQAEYSPHNIGHFGLAFPEYAHFTSPIRRYPDLLVHRAIKHVLSRQPVESFAYGENEMQQLGVHCSFTERRADDATRDATAVLKCEFMLDKVGEDFDGTVSSVTSFGLFVELKEFYVEGLVHITALNNDYYYYDHEKHRLIGERTRIIYKLGDPIRVRVVQVSLDDKKINFELAESFDENE